MEILFILYKQYKMSSVDFTTTVSLHFSKMPMTSPFSLNETVL